jgi:hypothetical protein
MEREEMHLAMQLTPFNTYSDVFHAEMLLHCRKLMRQHLDDCATCSEVNRSSVSATGNKSAAAGERGAA